VSTRQKIVSLAEGAQAVQAAQAAGESVVMCHGCFDIVHPGHIRHLRHARTFGDRLIVTVTNDADLRKGEGRPLIPQELRAENLAALDCVDWVCVNSAPTAEGALTLIRPDVYVKGREYERSSDPRFLAEREAVTSYGGRVMFSSGDVVFSSTALIAALEDQVNPFHARLKQLISQHDLTPAALDPLIAGFAGRRIVVIGETIIDTYVMCDRPDVAGEGPIMALRPTEYRRFDGGGAIVAKHLAAMGARPTLITALPRNTDAERLRQRLAHAGVDVAWIEVESAMLEKQRFLVGSSKVMKLDLGRPLALDLALQEQLQQLATETCAGADAAIIADFGLGLFSPASMPRLCRAIRPYVNVLAGDVSGRRSNLLHMDSMDLVCPSESELRDALHEYDDGLAAVAWRALDRTHSRSAIVTLGADGLIAFDRHSSADGRVDWRSRLTGEHVPSFAPVAVDPLGCGDALLAATTLALASGASFVRAAVLGCLAAAAQAQRLGNAVIDAADLRRGVHRIQNAQLAWAGETDVAPCVAAM
jgi:rfaE bifunctional protein nucleotidyltransferase chain/domain